MTDDNRSNLFDTGRRTILGGIAGLATVSLVGTGAAQEEQDAGHDPNAIIEEWDQEPTEIAETTMDSYGEPDEAVPSRLIWHHDDDAPWTRTELFRDPVVHNFPMQHNDYLEQFVDYHVPPRLYDEIAHYDGSVMLERTAGRVSARCDVEAMNFLAINLTHDIVTGEKTPEQARRAYAEDAMAFKGGEQPEYTQGLQFELPDDEQWDPDVEVIVDGEIDLGANLDHGAEDEVATGGDGGDQSDDEERSQDGADDGDESQDDAADDEQDGSEDDQTDDEQGDQENDGA